MVVVDTRHWRWVVRSLVPCVQWWKRDFHDFHASDKSRINSTNWFGSDVQKLKFCCLLIACNNNDLNIKNIVSHYHLIFFKPPIRAQNMGCHIHFSLVLCPCVCHCQGSRIYPDDTSGSLVQCLKFNLVCLTLLKMTLPRLSHLKVCSLFACFSLAQMFVLFIFNQISHLRTSDSRQDRK